MIKALLYICKDCGESFIIAAQGNHFERKEYYCSKCKLVMEIIEIDDNLIEKIKEIANAKRF